MPFYDFFWTEENEDHVAQHRVSRQEFEEVVLGCPTDCEEESASSGLPVCRGYTSSGRLLFFVFEQWPDGLTVFPVTAYEIGGDQ